MLMNDLRIVSLKYFNHYLSKHVNNKIRLYIINNNQRTLQRIRNGLHTIKRDERMISRSEINDL